MNCHSCGAVIGDDVATCPDCGAAVGGQAVREEGDASQPDAGQQPQGGQQTETGGGQPGDGDHQGRNQPTGGEESDDVSRPQGRGQPSAGGQPQGNQGPAGGRSQNTQPAGGQPAAGGQSAAGGQQGGGRQHGAGGQQGAAGNPGVQPGAGGPGARGGQAGGHPPRRSGSSVSLGQLARDLPLTGGAVIGSVALLIPYAIVTGASLLAVDTDPLETAAELFFTIAEFGSGSAFVDRFVDAAGIGPLYAVNPSDYPSVEDKLDRALDVLTTNPDAAILLLYLLFPWAIYLGGRHLARHYATGDTIVERLRAGATVLVGTIPVTVVLGLLFSVDDLATRIVFVGVVVPVVVGALGALTIFAFDHYASFLSKVGGWVAVGLGLVFTYLIFTIDLPGPYELDFVQKLLYTMMAYLATVTFEVGFGTQGTLVFLAVVLTGLLAGFLRIQLGPESIGSRIEGAQLGASVMLGFVGAIALLGVVLPLLSIVITLPFGASGLLAAVLPTLSDFGTMIVVGGAVFPLVFGGAGGYLAVVYQERQQQPAY